MLLPYTATNEGAGVKYVCNKGFQPQTIVTSRCFHNRSWIPDPANHVCSGMYVLHSGWVEVGRVFLFNSGQCLIRKLPQLCPASALNINSVLRIILAECSTPELPVRTKTINVVRFTSCGNAPGSKVTFQCHKGLYPDIPITITCMIRPNNTVYWSPDPTLIQCSLDFNNTGLYSFQPALLVCISKLP